MSDTSYNTEYLEVGDTFEGSSRGQSYFISAVLGAGGKVAINGKLVTIISLPKVEVTPEPVDPPEPVVEATPEPVEPVDPEPVDPPEPVVEATPEPVDPEPVAPEEYPLVDLASEEPVVEEPVVKAPKPRRRTKSSPPVAFDNTEE